MMLSFTFYNPAPAGAEGDNERILTDESEENTFLEESEDKYNLEHKDEDKKVKSHSIQEDGVLREGDRDNTVLLLMEQLILVEFGDMNLDDKYGSFTSQRVSEFQEYYGLEVNGIANQDTQKKLKEILDSPLQEGKRNSEVLKLKEKLTALGFDGMNSNDYYGSFTFQIVKEFQIMYGLKSHGIADEETLAQIEATLDSNEDVSSEPDSSDELESDVEEIEDDNREYEDSSEEDSEEDLDNTEKSVEQDEVEDKDNIESKPKETTALIDKGKISLSKSVSASLEEGAKDPEVIELKKNLTKLGYGGMNLNDLYGSFTAKRVKEFQKYYGITQTGKAGPRTLAQIDSLLPNPLSEGKRHKDTVTLKKNLNKLGYGGMNLNDLYGSFTTKQVKEFQKYYGITQTGKAGPRTLAQIDSLLPNPLSEGKRHKDTVTLKGNLNKLSYGGMNLNELYGSFTTKRVKEFQKYYGITQTGKAGPRTLAQIDSLLPNPLSEGKRHKDTVALKEDLKKIGYGGMNLNDLYGPFTTKRVKEFQTHHGITQTGNAGPRTLAAIDKAVKEAETKEKTTYTNYNMTLKQAIDKQMGRSPQTDKYRNDPAYISAAYVEFTSSGARTTSDLNIRSQANASSHIYATVPKGTSVNVTKRGSSWHTISFGSWRNPTRSDVQAYVDPDKNDRFQHLLLTSSVGVKASELNKTLVGKGKLSGQGQAFIDGAKKHSVNEAYLISHAILETGHGSSTLAKGVKINGVTVYNMFGIGAYDSCPVQCGAQYAYDKGWTTPYKAIVGGAEFIGRDYVHNQYEQNTLYKMRWNHVYAPKQYATDIGWAVKQVSQIKRIYDQLDNPFLHFDKPKFK